VAIAEGSQLHQWQVFDSILDLFSIESPGFDKAGSFIDRR
jgi:hypothetical protein